jgi:lipoprotein-releasing system permease protein
LVNNLNYNQIDNIIFKENSGIKKLFTRIAIASIMIGCFALIVSISVLEGFERELNLGAINFDSHVRVSTFDRKAISNSQQKIDSIRYNFKLNSIFMLIEDFALLKSDGQRDGLLIKGANQSYLNKKDFLNNFENTKNNSSNNWIILGKSKAIKLGVSLGDTLVLMSYKNNLVNSSIDKFICTSIYETGFGDFDDNIAYIDFGRAQEFFDYKKDNCSIFEIYLDEPENADKISNEISSLLGWPIYSKSVFEIHQSIFAWIEIQKEPIPLVLGLISLVAAFNIITVFLINIVDKYKSIGILRCLGLSSKSIVLNFIKQGLKLGAKGILIGSVLAFILLEAQNYFHFITLPSDIYFLSSVPVVLSFEIFFYVGSVTMLLTFLVSIIPAFVAGRVKPISAINFE